MLDTTKLSEDSSWFQKASKSVAQKLGWKKTTNEENESQEETQKKRMMVQFDDTDEFESITEEMLSSALESMNRLNESTISVESYDNPYHDNSALLDLQVCTKFEKDLEWLNSTIGGKNEDQSESISIPDERPIRNRKQTQHYGDVVKW